MQNKSKNFLEIKQDTNDMLIVSLMASVINGFEDGWKFMKMLFLYDYYVLKDYNFVGLASEYFRYRQGAYSKRIAMLRNNMLHGGYITDETVHTSLTTIGYQITDELIEKYNLKDTQEYQTLQDIGDTYSRQSGRELMHMLYSYKVGDHKIEDYDDHSRLISFSDFENRKWLLDDLNKKEIVTLYAKFIFPETHGKEKEYIEMNSFDELENEFKIA